MEHEIRTRKIGKCRRTNPTDFSNSEEIETDSKSAPTCGRLSSSIGDIDFMLNRYVLLVQLGGKSPAVNQQRRGDNA
jgi:hypothetical protein